GGLRGTKPASDEIQCHTVSRGAAVSKAKTFPANQAGKVMAFSIGYAPDDVGLARLAAHRALAHALALLEGHAPGGDTYLLFHGQLAVQRAAPLGFHKAAVVLLQNGLDLLPGLR